MEFFGYTKCSTCRDAYKALKQKGHHVTFQDFVHTPPTSSTLRSWISLCGRGVKPFLNTKGIRYKELGLGSRHLTEDDWIELLSGDGRLLKRPVLVLEDDVIIGFDKERYAELPQS